MPEHGSENQQVARYWKTLVGRVQVLCSVTRNDPCMGIFTYIWLMFMADVGTVNIPVP